jgi:hypothetical protein
LSFLQRLIQRIRRNKIVVLFGDEEEEATKKELKKHIKFKVVGGERKIED